MDATASSVAASTGRGRGAACGCGARGAAAGAAAGVAAITTFASSATASRRYGLDLVSGSVQDFGAVLARSLVKISLICEIPSLVCLQTAAARTSGATKGLAIRGQHDRA